VAAGNGRIRNVRRVPAPDAKPAEASATEVVRAIRRIIRAVDIHSKRVGRSVGLTVPQTVVLGGIRDLGEVTSSTLSAHVHLSPPTVTTILDNLEARGLVERVRSAVDRRVVHPRLTEAGCRVLDAAPPLLQSEFMSAFAELPAAERHAIVAAFEQVADMMDAPEADVAAVLDIGRIGG
jgi:DNA-binding MarR family transcriptional regulator